jgi:hypothetical protein
MDRLTSKFTSIPLMRVSVKMGEVQADPKPVPPWEWRKRQSLVALKVSPASLSAEIVALNKSE